MTPIGHWTPWAGSSPRFRRRSPTSSSGSRWNYCGCASTSRRAGSGAGKRASPSQSVAAAGLKPWRELVTPHKDVASGRYQQAEFAADLWQVHLGEGTDEYRDPVEFFRRTYLTESLKGLLAGAIHRLAGQGGDPVVQLQTNFGGGKTHSMLALYHLFSGTDARGAGRYRLRAAGSSGNGAPDGPPGGAGRQQDLAGEPDDERRTARSFEPSGASWRGNWAAGRRSTGLQPTTRTRRIRAMRYASSSTSMAPAWSSSTSGWPTPASSTTRAIFPPAASRPSSALPRP